MTLLRYESIPIKDTGEPLVDLGTCDFVLEPMYYKMGLSSEPRMFLRKSVVEKLSEIQRRLGGYKLKIWDGWRPRSVQLGIYEDFRNKLEKMHPEWSKEKVLTEVGVFVTAPNDPNRIPPHATGGTVDLTLIDDEEKELDMGTPFDHFGPEAASLFFEENSGNKEARKNRKILRDAMASAGFSVDKDEWWHFDYGNQKWAVELGYSESFYGEAEIPEYEKML